MAEILDLITAAPSTLGVTATVAFWGAGGAFIYGAPRWLACAVPVKGIPWRCTVEGLISLAIGGVAAAAFSQWLLVFLHQRPADLPAVAAMIGLLANPVAPKLVESLATLVASRAAKLVNGDDK